MVGLAYPAATLHEADGIAGACAILGAQPAVEIVLLDLSMQGVTGFEGLMAIRARAPRVPILVVSGLEDPRIIRRPWTTARRGSCPRPWTGRP